MLVCGDQRRDIEVVEQFAATSFESKHPNVQYAEKLFSLILVIIQQENFTQFMMKFLHMERGAQLRNFCQQSHAKIANLSLIT